MVDIVSVRLPDFMHDIIIPYILNCVNLHIINMRFNNVFNILSYVLVLQSIIYTTVGVTKHDELRYVYLL